VRKRSNAQFTRFDVDEATQVLDRFDRILGFLKEHSIDHSIV
jgi:hypothetical protein